MPRRHFQTKKKELMIKFKLTIVYCMGYPIYNIFIIHNHNTYIVHCEYSNNDKKKMLICTICAE